jgi:excisionase family DNA binding protein
MMIHPEDTKEAASNYVTIGEAARYLGVGRRIVYQLIEFERIRASRRRRVILVDRDSLDEFRRSGGDA